MKRIPLTQGKFALVDDADYDYLRQWKWYAQQSHRTFYAGRNVVVRRTGNINEYKRRTEWMHRAILRLLPSDKQQADHRDGNGLNNQQSNLRTCSHFENKRNRKKQLVATSKYKGVDWYRRYDRWRSSIRVNKRLIHLGYFDFEVVAAQVYNQAASKHFGEFARLNTF